MMRVENELSRAVGWCWICRAARQSSHRRIGLRQPRVKPGWCFVAIGRVCRRQSVHRHCIKSRSNGDRKRCPAAATRCCRAQVEHGRRALARLSANFYGRPAEKLSISGITGTNGKTTTSFLLNAMLRAGGRKTALIGTVEYRIEDEHFPAPHTTRKHSS